MENSLNPNPYNKLAIATPIQRAQLSSKFLNQIIVKGKIPPTIQAVVAILNVFFYPRYLSMKSVGMNPNIAPAE